MVYFILQYTMVYHITILYHMAALLLLLFLGPARISRDDPSADTSVKLPKGVGQPRMTRNA